MQLRWEGIYSLHDNIIYVAVIHFFTLTFATVEKE